MSNVFSIGGALHTNFYSDKSVLRRLQHRDRTTIEAVWDLEYRRLLHLALGIVKDRAVAEQLTGDILDDFIYRYVDGLQKSSSIPSYLTVMALRRGRRAHAKRLRQQEFDEQSVLYATFAVDDNLHRKGQLEKLQRCLKKLGSKALRTLSLHFGLDQSYSTIATELGVSKQAVGKAVQKSLAALRQCIEALPEERGEATHART